MIDVELQQFYDDVKDPSWPKIRTYIDISKLSTEIKEEIKLLHNLQTRKDQISDIDYWTKYSKNVFVHKNLAFIPIEKCASTYYIDMFTKLGWEEKYISDININKTKFIGVMSDPITRWAKGITEWLIIAYSDLPLGSNRLSPPRTVEWNKLVKQLQDPHFCRAVSSVSVGDIHSTTYHSILGSMLYKSNWIPLGFGNDNDVKHSFMAYFQKNGHDIPLPLDTKRTHVSTPQKLHVYNIIEKLLLGNKDTILNFYKLFHKDIAFYYNLVDTYTPDWQHI